MLDAATRTFYDAWKARYLVNGCARDRYYVFVSADGQDTGGNRAANSVSVSEGHGYGMLIMALMAGHDPQAKVYFDGLYRFFRQWGSTGTVNYLREAQAVIAAIKQKEVNPSTWLIHLGDFVDPAEPGFYYGTRPSDFMPDHYRVFQSVTGDVAWRQVLDAGYRLLTWMQTRYSPAAGLVPDFISGYACGPAARGTKVLGDSPRRRLLVQRLPGSLASRHGLPDQRRAASV